jgi:hypothetical protein
MRNRLGLAVAASLFFGSPTTHADPDLQLAVAVSIPRTATSAFKSHLKEPAYREAIKNCTESADDVAKTLSPNFPRELPKAQRALFDRLMFRCVNPTPEVYGAFGSASEKAAKATMVPLASVRIVMDTFETVTPRSLTPEGCYYMYCRGGKDLRIGRIGKCPC